VGKRRPTLSTSPLQRPDRRCDILVVGAGAAGLLAALASRGVLGEDGGDLPLRPDAPDVVLLNNESRIGLKILVSGGGRCNVTNAHVDERDYESDAPHLVRRLLRGFPPASIRNFFETRDCPLYEEALGKVFPRSDAAKDVLRVLLEAIERAGIPLLAPAEVVDLEPAESAMKVRLATGEAWTASEVILATGGKSLPKTGSRGLGLLLLAKLGHDLAPALPGLAPLLLEPTSPLRGLAGLTVPAVLTLAPASSSPAQLAGKNFKPIARAGGSLLVTHKGATGPAPFDVSGPCGRAISTGAVALRGDFWSLTRPDGAWGPYLHLPKAPGASLPWADVPRPPTQREFEQQAATQLAKRNRGLGHAFSSRIPRSLLQRLLQDADLDPSQPLKQLDAKARTRLWLAVTQTDLQLAACEGYAKAEVTHGGVRLQELSPATLESRRREHLFCCGEVVNVTGRLGGFNFQWAWSSGFAAGRGAARRSSRPRPSPKRFGEA